MIPRYLSKVISSKLWKGKAIVLIGPRQAGKTTLINNVLKGREHLFLNGDDSVVRNILENANTESLKRLIANHEIVFLDEAQRISGIGLTSKIIIDQFKEVQLILSGSSSFDLNNEMNEPLTGRKWNFELFPVCWSEYEEHVGYLVSEQTLTSRLVFGMYPDVINNPGNESEILKNLVDSYLFKDILSLSGIQKPRILEKLVQLIAYQCGEEVSLNELSQNLEIDKNTVDKYLDLLEKAYVIFRLGSYSNNLRNEIKRNQKIYFYDNGIRNAVIGDFSDINNRNDMGKIWANFIVSEMIKTFRYRYPDKRIYFWRTRQGTRGGYCHQKCSGNIRFRDKVESKNKSAISKKFS